MQWLSPEILVAGNAGYPLSSNDGALWSGRGLNASVGAGVTFRRGAWHLVIAPEMTFSGNTPFETNENSHYFSPAVPADRADKAAFLDPWYVRPFSADVPRRFGASSFLTVTTGQSGLWYAAGPIEVGATSENMWWGPGVRNAILMSDNAAGIPRLELRSTQPWSTSVGVFAARWFVGALQESKYFDDDPHDDVRSLAAAVVTWRPAFQPWLTIGLERSVFATATGYGQVPLRWFDVFANTGHPNDHAPTDSSLTPGGRDQLIGIFGRWVFPTDGVETYFEWARQELPRSFKELVTSPTNGHGYTIGLQWLRLVPPGMPALRIQAEITTLEQSSSFRDHNVGVFYTSRRVLQGYTQDGQPIGASIGPGSSSQWLAFDRVAPTWSWGITFNRIRWNEDVHSIYSWPGYAGYCNHDVSLIPGVRGSRLTSRGIIGAEVMFNDRHNVFFQNVGGCKAGSGDQVDNTSPNLRIMLSPSLHW